MIYKLDRLTLKYGLTILILVTVTTVLFTGIAVAQTKATFTPRISVSETYDDNIDLEPDNEDSDWITVVSPGFLLEVDSQKTQLDLDYEAGFSFYAQDSSRDTTRHQARISWDQLLAEHLSLNVNNTFSRSEDPITVEDDRITDISDEREVEYRNTGVASLSWQFGTEDTVTAKWLGPIESLPLPSRQEVNQAVLTKNWHWQPTGMDISADGRLAVILTYRAVYVFRLEPEGDLYEALSGQAYALGLGNFRDAESVAFHADGESIFVTVERRHAPLLRIDLKGGLPE